MKHKLIFILFLAGLSALSGYLMSQMSWIGRVGINLMHHEYKFLKVWWQGGAVVFGVLMLLFLIHAGIHDVLRFYLAKLVHLLILGAAVFGIYITYNDFSTDFTHGILKQRFHLGAYLFWVGWVMICLYFLFSSKKKPLPPSITPERTA